MLSKLNSYLAKEISYDSLYVYLIELERQLNDLGEFNFLKVDKEKKNLFKKYPCEILIDDYRHQIELLNGMSHSIYSYLDGKIQFSFFIDSIIDLYTELCCYITSVPNLPFKIFEIAVYHRSLLDRGIEKKSFTNQELNIITRFVDMVKLISEV